VFITAFLPWLWCPFSLAAPPAGAIRGRHGFTTEPPLSAKSAKPQASPLAGAKMITHMNKGAVPMRVQPQVQGRFDELVDTAELRVEPVTHDQARIARDAYRDFGKGSGHKASLDFGDCFAYALARSTGEPLLFKGNGFGYTDITPALPARPDDDSG
jgi:ribonuclease VapC